MKIGLSLGLQISPVEAAASNPMAGVSQDATSLIYVPDTAAEWTIAMAAAGLATGNPSHLYRCQEASGNLADSIGSATEVASGALSYQQSVAGWTRKGVKTNADPNAFFLGTTAASFSSSSGLVLQLFKVGSNPGAARILNCLGSTFYESAGVVPGPKLRALSNAAGANGSVNCSGVIPVVTKLDVTNSAMKVYSQSEKISTTYTAQSAVNGSILYLLGDGGGQASDWTQMYCAVFRGSAAELSDAQIKTLLQTLGWTVAWS